MKRSCYKRVLAVAVSCLLAAGTWTGGNHLPFGVVSYAAERQASVNATNLNVRSGAGTGYPSVAKLSQGASVMVVGEQKASDGVLWYQVRFHSQGTEMTGYVSSRYIKFPVAIANDSDFERYLNQQGFPESYKQGLRELHAQYPKWIFTAFNTNLDWNTVIENESIVGRNLVSKDSISSWKSTAAGAYNWDSGTWPGFDGNSWVQASSGIISYYMDPRNFINDKYIFQFLKQSYDGSIHTKEGLLNMVSGTFLAGTGTGGMGNSGGVSAPGSSSGNSGTDSGAVGPGASGPGAGAVPAPGKETGNVPGGNPSDSGSSDNGTVVSPLAPGVSKSSQEAPIAVSYGPGMDSSWGDSSGDSGGNTGSAPMALSGGTSYADILMNAASQSGVSPYILASMILQEQGSQGTGRSISGTVAGYEGYYNFFNIEAYQSGSMGAVQRGLWWASQSGSYGRPWNSVERSILGGSVYYGENYVKKGQNTLYLKKFNVQGNNLYKHQYMTNVQAAAAEGMSLSKINALKDTALEFSIPIYKNMPDSVCAKPTGDGSPNNKLSGLGVEGFALTPTFNRDTESYDLIVDSSVASVNVAAAAIDSSAVVAGTGTASLQNGANEITVAVKAGNGDLRYYVIHIVRQTNGPTYSDSIGSGVSGGNGPGGSFGGGPGSDSKVEIITPPGTSGNQTEKPGNSSGNKPGGSTDSGNTPQAPGSSNGNSGGGVLAPDGSHMNGFGTPETDSSLVAPGQPSDSASGPAGNGTSGKPGTKPSGQLRGDTNGDGKVDIKDALLVQRHLLGLSLLEGVQKDASDVNGNGKIDIMDLLGMQRDILGIEKLN